MMDFHSKRLFLSLTFSIAFLAAFTANAADKSNPKSTELPAEGRESVNGNPEGMQFKTDSPSESNEIRKPLKFKIPGVNSAEPNNHAPESAFSADQPFVANVGYPKHQIGAVLMPQSFAGKWSYQGQDYNFSTGVINYGIKYRYLAAPTLVIEAEWNHFSVKSSTDNISTYLVSSSKSSNDSYTARGEYCFISSLTFFKQLCPGVVVGSDSYPILKFQSDGTTLDMGKVDDIILGLSLRYQLPITDILLFKAMGGYNSGLGSNSGTVKSSTNSSYFLKASTAWMFRPRQELNFGLEYLVRTVAVSSSVTGSKRNWDSNSSALGLRLAYFYTF